MDDDPLWWPAQRLVDAYRDRSLSPVEVSELAQARIAEVNPTLHAFVLATPELARRQAALADKAYREGSAGPLAGVPISIKDAFHIAGHVTTLGSLAHTNDVARHDSGAVRPFSPFISVGPLARCVADARRLHSVLSADGAATGDSPGRPGPTPRRLVFQAGGTFLDIPRWCCPPGSLTACQSRSNWWDDTEPTPSCCRSPSNSKPDWMCVPSPAWHPACESRERRHP